MSAEDAALELDATAEDLLVFREAETYRINVIYRQKDGNHELTQDAGNRVLGVLRISW